ncbi:MAG: aspartate--tRNA ligase, partial [Elusimicrobia bacterium]|nr:aspartate--tRNA ligase [Elusimicrobiota bacterium]
MKRTHYCGEPNLEHLGNKVTLCGWVHSRRDHGGVIFVDLRDREGVVQLVFNPESSKLFQQAEQLHAEYVLMITGLVQKRPKGTINPKLPTGEIEIIVETLEILNTCETLPFEISEFSNAGEELRLKYRYLDLRRPQVKENILFRNKLTSALRKHLSHEGFTDIETPFLTKSTPEGARDFLVPSRLNPGTFYALPQSPQLFKQLLMVSGFDKYYQIVRCFRDEDLRADRQPEFTQVDIEMSFVEPDDVMTMTEKLLCAALKEATGIEIKTPFKRMDYAEALSRYGSDKPDLRFGLELVDISDIVKTAKFKVFSDTVANKGIVCGICCKDDKEKFSRQKLLSMTEIVAPFGAKGLAWIKITTDGFDSPIAKFFTPEELAKIKQQFGAQPGTIIFFVADKPNVTYNSLGCLRNYLGKELNLIDTSAGKLEFLWVVNFPLLEWNAENKRWVSMHHPFTMPNIKDISEIGQATAGIKALAYDIVLNGTELGGGSIRI